MDRRISRQQDGERIHVLPSHIIAQIKSSVAITSLTSTILGLVENSLDAEATKIDINVDFRRGGCVVEDNGLGIPSPEFTASGGLGKLHCQFCGNGTFYH
jgi:DNA mismatch repair protein MLH3